jgi:hypothetical protein
MAGSVSSDAVVRALLRRHGTTYADEIGIRLGRGGPSPLFRLLCAALLLSARISTDLAVAAARALAEHGWTTPRKLKGIGDVGADIFLREAQRVWPELRPFFDERALRSARRLELPADPRRLAALAPRGDSARLAAALVRAGIAKDHREILADV